MAAEPLKAQFWDQRVNWRLTLFRRPDAAPYSSEVQQPVRATAIMSVHPHTRNAAPLEREHGRSDSLHPDGLAALAAFWPHEDAHLLRTSE